MSRSNLESPGPTGAFALAKTQSEHIDDLVKAIGDFDKSRAAIKEFPMTKLCSWLMSGWPPSPKSLLSDSNLVLPRAEGVKRPKCLYGDFCRARFIVLFGVYNSD